MWDHRLTLVVAPAGSGKTTVLSQFASRAEVPAAWYRAEPADASPPGLLAHLEQSIRAALTGLPAGAWADVDDLLAGLEAAPLERALVVIDDLHALWGTEAEAVLERLVAHLPPAISLLAGTRRLPGFDLSRLRVAGDLLELSADDLRFRAWEVEQLFRDVYGTPMPPGELAELARRTEGWAAGLQLFHLATRDKPATDRRRLLRELGVRSRILREYLTRNVLDDLPLHLREFLVGTSVLGRLTAPLCDELLGGSSASALLRELEERQLFTTALDEDGAYRYHEVLRSHLEAQLVERVGEEAARAQYGRAALLLEQAGHLPDAVRAYSRAEDWTSVSRLLGGNGQQVIDGPSSWVDALPPALVEHDPWLLLARARRFVGLGRWDAAVDAYDRAAQTFGRAGPAAGDCQRERATLAAWLDSEAVGPPDWTGLLRQASRRDPSGVHHLAHRAVGDRAHAALVQGLAALLAGEVRVAARALGEAAEDETASAPVVVAATLGAGVALALAGDAGAARLLDRASEQAEAAGLPWLAGLARAALGLVPDVVAPELAAAAAATKEDPWGSALAALFAGLGLVRTGSAGAGAVEALSRAVEGFEQVGSPVLETWARAALAAASPEALSDARATLSRARALGVPGAALLASIALVTADPRFASEHRAACDQLARDTGIALAGPPAPAAGGGARTAHLEVTCFGELAVRMGGEPVDLAQVKPRVRSLLRLLALRAGTPVHREQIIDALWPDEVDVKAGLRNLQTAVSALRQLLEPGVARGEASIVVRDGDTYRLSIGDGDAVDVAAFERALAARDWAGALGAYGGDLFPDEGSAEWVVGERDRLRMAAADAAQGAADEAMAAGDFATAITTAEHGLRLDGYRDGLWRVLIEASERAGAHAAAEQARRRYERVLEDLGV